MRLTAFLAMGATLVIMFRNGGCSDVCVSDFLNVSRSNGRAAVAMDGDGSLFPPKVKD